MVGVREELVSAMCAMWLEGGRVLAQEAPGAHAFKWPPEEILHEVADALMDPDTLAASLRRMAAQKDSPSEPA
jgi:hypothetical protein